MTIDSYADANAALWATASLGSPTCYQLDQYGGCSREPLGKATGCPSDRDATAAEPTSQADCTEGFTFATDMFGGRSCTRCLDTLLNGPHRDFPIRMEAGEYLTAKLTLDFDATLELIGPDASVPVTTGIAVPTGDDWQSYLNQIKSSVPAHGSAQRWNAYLAGEGGGWDPAVAAAWARSDTGRANCFFSVNHAIPSDGSASTDGRDGGSGEKHLIYDGTGYIPSWRDSVCGGAHTMHYRVLVNPPAGNGVLITATLERQPLP